MLTLQHGLRRLTSLWWLIGIPLMPNGLLEACMAYMTTIQPHTSYVPPPTSYAQFLTIINAKGGVCGLNKSQFFFWIYPTMRTFLKNNPNNMRRTIMLNMMDRFINVAR
jgi:hypothetical protein